MTANIDRYTILADQEWHKVELSRPILNVDADQHHIGITFSTTHNADAEPQTYRLRVFDIGQEIDARQWVCWGAIISPGSYAWHLIEDVTAKDATNDSCCGCDLELERASANIQSGQTD